MNTRRLFLFLSASSLCQARYSAHASALPDCEWCGAAEAPAKLKSSITVADENEPGKRLVLQGTVYAPDGVTPAPGVTLYLYHTNNDGLYAPRGDDSGNGRRHGHLRGWLISDNQGNFEVRTILPGYYPNRQSPRHIHMTVKEPGQSEYWIESVLFAGDPFITAAGLESREVRGGPGIVTMKRGTSNELLVRRDVILWRPR